MTEEEQILTSILDCRRVDLYVKKPTLTDSQQKQFEEILKRREKHEPLQYILGDCEFYGLKFQVNPNVLIPRPETELLVERVLNHLKKNSFDQAKILDLGTGSGNISIALAKNLPSAKITSVDISIKALAVAEVNAKNNGVESQISFVHQDMSVFLNRNSSDETFDVIVSNPPYISKELMIQLPRDVQKEPILALSGGEDGLDFYRSIISKAPRFLNKNGFLFLEIGDNQSSAIEELFKTQTEYQSCGFFKDYTDRTRIAWAW